MKRRTTTVGTELETTLPVFQNDSLAWCCWLGLGDTRKISQFLLAAEIKLSFCFHCKNINGRELDASRDIANYLQANKINSFRTHLTNLTNHQTRLKKIMKYSKDFTPLFRIFNQNIFLHFGEN